MFGRRLVFLYTMFVLLSFPPSLTRSVLLGFLSVLLSLTDHQFTPCSLFIHSFTLTDSLEVGWGFHGNRFHSPACVKGSTPLKLSALFAFPPEMLLLRSLSFLPVS